MNDNSRSACTRRRFLQASAATAVAGAVGRLPARAEQQVAATRDKARLPVVIASANGLKAIERSMSMLKAKADPLDAVITAVNVLEDDPNDHSVGLGGLPNERGVVELDASCMHGPTHKAGAVAALRNIRNPSSVAKLVMQRTDHVLIVGDGALQFAKAHGFKEEELLTDAARKHWLQWKESLSNADDWISPSEAAGKTRAQAPQPFERTWGTINCCAVDASGDIAGVTTTSGLSYKIPGRVGDSPIIGAGLYVDNAVGAAGSTGRGEANLQDCSSFLVVELMRTGMSPEEACLQVLGRVSEHTEPRLRDKSGRPTFNLQLYAVAKDGRHAAAAMWSGAKYAVDEGAGPHLMDCAYRFKRS